MPTTVDIESQRMLLGSTPVRKLYHGTNLIGTRIAELFAGGVPGVWFDPSDLSTMYQDAGGTIPVTGVEQPVGRMLDKSGNGNHASQATTTARPILSAKYNLLSSSANVSATPWTSTVGTFSFAPTAPYIGGEAYRVTNNGTGTFRFIAHPFTAQIGTYTVSAIVEEDIANPSEYTDLGMLQAPSTTLGRIRIHWPTGTVGTASASPLNARGSLLSAVGPNGGRVFSIQFETPVTAVGEHRVLFYPSSTTQNTTGVILHCVDVRLFVDAALPSFQPVVSQTEYQTEGFPYYLRFDGVDDFLDAGALDFSAATQSAVVTGIKKLSDAIAASPYSHGLLTGQNGAFRLLAPANAGQASVRAASRGADGVGQETVGTNDKAAPIKLVLCSTYGAGAPVSIRYNGTESRVSSGTLGALTLPSARSVIGAQVTGETTQSSFFSGRIYGLAHIARALSTVEQRILEQFIRNKSRAY